MRVETVGEYTITAWAEPLSTGWQGMASISPAIANLWSGGPNRDSLVVDGVHDAHDVAVASALSQALESLAKHLGGGAAVSQPAER